MIAVPSGSPNESAAMRAVGNMREMIRDFGFSDSTVAMEPYSGGRDPSAPIRLAYLRYVAEGPECGHWPTNLAYDPRNLPYPNFGCAQQHNLAAQIVNPADLLGPRTMAPADAERRAVVIDRYRQGKATGCRQGRRRARAGQRRITEVQHEQAGIFGRRGRSRRAGSWFRPRPTSSDTAAPPKARPIPRISIQAFCEDPKTAEVLQAATADRRLAKSHVSVHMGGAPAAVAHYLESPTPNLIIVETTLPRNQMLAELDRLAECCDAGTKVVVIGHMNDVVLYRELLKRGVSEYLIAPVAPMQLIESLSNLYNNPATDPVGNVIAFIGAKGGVGSSTVCHNAAWAMSEILKSNVVVADLDLAFGTTGLDFNQDPVQGIAEALQSPERLDEVLLDRLLTKCSERLSIFAAPVVLDRDYDISADACDIVLDIVRQNVPFVAVDLPHTWTPWVKRVLLQADEIVITAVPDLANLRNAKNLIDLLKQNRTNDGPPRLVMNMVKTPKRPEISVKEFSVGARSRAGAGDRVRQRDLRAGLQQRPDDRGVLRQGEGRPAVPRAGARPGAPQGAEGRQEEVGCSLAAAREAEVQALRSSEMFGKRSTTDDGAPRRVVPPQEVAAVAATARRAQGDGGRARVRLLAPSPWCRSGGTRKSTTTSRRRSSTR